MTNITREDVEALLAVTEQVHKPNHGLIAELCRHWLATRQMMDVFNSEWDLVRSLDAKQRMAILMGKEVE